MKYYKKTLNIEIKIFSLEHRDIAMTLFHVRKVYFQLGQLDTALDKFETVIGIQEKAPKVNHAFTVKVIYNIAKIHLKKGDSRKSMEMFITTSLICQESRISDTSLEIFNWKIFNNKKECFQAPVAV